MKRQFQADNDGAIHKANAAITDLFTQYAQTIKSLHAADGALATKRLTLASEIVDLRTLRTEQWDAYREAMEKLMAQALADYLHQIEVQEQIDSLGGRALIDYQLKLEQNEQQANAFIEEKIAKRKHAQAATLALVDAVAPTLTDAWVVSTGTDVMGEKVSNGEYLLRLGSLALTLSGPKLANGTAGDYADAMNSKQLIRKLDDVDELARQNQRRARQAAAKVKKARAAARRRARQAGNGGCFYAGTVVHELVPNSQQTQATASVDALAGSLEQSNSDWWIVAAGGLLVALAVAKKERRRIKRASKDEEHSIDQYFCNAPDLPGLPPGDPLPNRALKSAENVAVLKS